MLKSGFIIEMNLGEENKRYATLSQTHHLQMTEMRSRIPGIQNCTSLLEIGTSFVGKLHAPLCTSMEAVKDLSLHSESSQKPFTAGEGMPENRSGSHGSPETVGEEAEHSSHPEMPVPSPPGLAQVSKEDEGIQCDLTWWTEVQSGNSPESSPGSGRRGADQLSVGSQNQDEVNEVENNGCEGQVPSPTWLAQVNKLDEGIQCDMGCSEAQVEKSPSKCPPGVKRQHQTAKPRDLGNNQTPIGN